jgi:hypothetical protein
MALVAALFPSEEEAERAIDSLAGTDFEALELTIYGGDVPAGMVGTRAAGTPDTVETVHSGPTARAAISQILDSLDDEALASVFEEAMDAQNCVLVAATVDDAKAVDLAAFLQKLGGRATLND